MHKSRTDYRRRRQLEVRCGCWKEKIPGAQKSYCKCLGRLRYQFIPISLWSKESKISAFACRCASQVFPKERRTYFYPLCHWGSFWYHPCRFLECLGTRSSLRMRMNKGEHSQVGAKSGAIYVIYIDVWRSGLPFNAFHSAYAYPCGAGFPLSSMSKFA